MTGKESKPPHIRMGSVDDMLAQGFPVEILSSHPESKIAIRPYCTGCNDDASLWPCVSCKRGVPFPEPLQRNEAGYLTHNCAGSPEGPCDDCLAVHQGQMQERLRWLRLIAEVCLDHACGIESWDEECAECRLAKAVWDEESPSNG